MGDRGFCYGRESRRYDISMPVTGTIDSAFPKTALCMNGYKDMLIAMTVEYIEAKHPYLKANMNHPFLYFFTNPA